MKSICSKIKIDKEYIPFIYFFLLIIVLYMQCKLRYNTDDVWHIKNINNIGILRWVYLRIVTWQPRIFSDLMFAVIGFNMTIWSVYSALISTGTLFMISKIAMINVEDKNIIKNCNIFVCTLYFFIYPFLLNSATFWYAGSFYYVLPTFFLLLTIYPYILLINNKSLKYNMSVYILFLATTIVSYTEQTLLVCVVFIIFTLIYSRFKGIKINTYLVVNYIYLIINSLVFIALNFKAGRIGKEMYWYPDFPMLSTVDKVFQAINWTNYYYINSSNIIFTVFITTLTLNMYLLNKKSFKKIYLLPVIYMAINILPIDMIYKNINMNNIRGEEYLGKISSFLLGERVFDYLYNTMLAGPSSIHTSLKSLMPSFLGMLLILVVISMIIMAKKDKKESLFMIIMYMASIFSGYIMFITPTIFASGTRVFYLGTIILLIIITNLFSDINLKINTNKINYINYSLIGVAIPIYLQLFLIIVRMDEIL